MKLMRYIMVFCCSILLSQAVFAQKGTIRGSVIDGATGETMIGVTVVIKNTTNGAATDLDGEFEIKADPGVYDLTVTYISYKSVTIEGVEVKAGEVALLENIRMGEDAAALDEVIISAEVVRVTESALLTVKKKSVNLIDGISSANFRKIGDSNAAAAVKRVPGVSIEGGKYVYVRGLGDRYTKSTLNGMDIPGLDPDRNTLQMDIFPTNVLDNIIVKKTFTADLPADFTGGIVDIGLKDFPEEKVIGISVGLGYNPNMHFQNDYLTYEGSSTDFLGFDNGVRAIPTESNDIPITVASAFTSPENSQKVRDIMDGFSPIMAAENKQSAMDFNMNLSLGNQMKAGKVTLGYNVALTYKNDTKFYEDVEYGRYGKSTPSVIELEQREFQTGSFGENNVLAGLLGGVAMKTQLTKIRATFLHLQNGASKAGVFDYFNSDQGATFDAYQHNLEYTQRSITNGLLHGTHQISETSRFKVDWKLAMTKSNIEDPDIRFARYRTDSGGDDVSIGTEAGLPERIWRYLDETNINARADVGYSYKVNGLSGELKSGLAYVRKERDYEIKDFQLNVDRLPQKLTGDPNELFTPEYLWDPSTNRGVGYATGFLPTNTNAYSATASTLGAYISNEFKVAARLNTIVGLRMEKFTQLYSGLNQNNERFDNEKVIDNLDFFPAVSLIYELTEQQNLRASFARTTARPSFKESSFATILDPLTGRTFVGGLFPDVNVSTGEVIWDGNLRSTYINNFDLRWEIFQPGGQTVAVSGFYKRFNDPIEIVQYVQAPNNFQPRNVGDGEILGLEVELRKNFGFISETLSDLFFQTNMTFASSSIDMSETEYQSRLNNAREGQEIDDTRAMAGQAPYIVNAGFMYDGGVSGLETSLFYNVQGSTLYFVGIADRPDIYTVPFHSLNLAMNYTFGEADNLRVGFKASNLLNDTKEKVFKSHKAQDQLFERLAPRSSFSLSFAYDF